MLSINESAETPKNKTSAKKNILTAVIAILALAALGAAVWMYLNPPKPQTGTQLEASASLDSVLVSRKITAIPYMATDLDTVVYTADAAGNVVYYEYDGADFAELSPTGTMELTISLSGQQIPAKIPYVERDGVLTGYGAFTSNNTDANVYIYNFVMFKVCNLPAAYAEEGKCLLLIYTDQTQAYTLDPVWEGAYVLDRATGETTRFLSASNPSVGMSGAERTDFCMLTQTALTADTLAVPFLSGRAYDRVEGSETPVDIYVKDGSRERSVVTGVADKYIKPLGGDAFAFIRSTTGGFETVKYENGAESLISSFYSGYGTSYIRSGDYLLSKEDGRVYTTYDNTVIETKGYKINPLIFAVSPNGKYVVMAGTVANALDYRIYVYNTETENYVTFTETNYAAHGNMRFLDDHTVTYYVLNVEGYENVVLDLSKVK